MTLASELLKTLAEIDEGNVEYSGKSKSFKVHHKALTDKGYTPSTEFKGQDRVTTYTHPETGHSVEITHTYNGKNHDKVTDITQSKV